MGISASIVVGSMTLSANHNSVENVGGTAGDRQKWLRFRSIICILIKLDTRLYKRAPF